MVVASVLRDRLALERGDEVVFAEADGTEAAFAKGGGREPIAGTFVAHHLDTFVIGRERLIPR
jgi:hypothetical protein